MRAWTGEKPQALCSHTALVCSIAHRPGQLQPRLNSVECVRRTSRSMPSNHTASSHCVGTDNVTISWRCVVLGALRAIVCHHWEWAILYGCQRQAGEVQDKFSTPLA